MQLTQADHAALEALRRRLADQFGVTIVGDMVTVRFDEAWVTMQVIQIQLEDETRCWSCNDRIFGTVYKSTLTVEHCGGHHESRTIDMCYDCWCPK